jgi:hypothetical protein
MKAKIYILLFLLFSAAVLQVNSQTVSMNAVDPDGQTITTVKAFESRYFDGKVYLHVTVNGNTETYFVAVERSIDAKNFEIIGYVKIYGTDIQSDLAYYFTDESPVSFNLYYRIVDNSNFNEPAYSETLCVIPMCENKIPSTPLTTTSLSGEQAVLFIGGTN